MLATAILLLLALLWGAADAIVFKRGSAHATPHGAYILPATLVHDVSQNPLAAGSTTQQQLGSVKGLVVTVSMGQPLQHVQLALSFEHDAVELWSAAYPAQSASFARDKHAASPQALARQCVEGTDVFWFGWQPVRMPVRVCTQPNGGAGSGAAGVLGMARGSAWWLRFREASFAANAVWLGTRHELFGGGGGGARDWALQCMEDDGPARLCTSAQNATVTVGAWQGDVHVTLGIDQHDLLLPPAAHSVFMETRRDPRPRALLEPPDYDRANAGERRREFAESREPRSWPSVHIEFGGGAHTLTVAPAKLVQRDEGTMRQLAHVAAAAAAAAEGGAARVTLPSAMLSQFVVHYDSVAHAVWMHAHAVDDHIAWPMQLLLLALVVLLARWAMVEGTLLVRNGLADQRGTRAARRYEAFTLATEALGVLAAALAFVGAGAHGVFADYAAFLWLSVAAVVASVALEFLAVVITLSWHRRAPHMRAVAAAATVDNLYLNAVRSYAHRFTLSVGVLVAGATRASIGLDNVLNTLVGLYLFYVAFQATATNVYVLAAVPRVHAAAPDAFVLLVLATAVVQPASLAYIAWALHRFLLTPFLRRNALEMSDISAMSTAITLALLVGVSLLMLSVTVDKSVQRMQDYFREVLERKQAGRTSPPPPPTRGRAPPPPPRRRTPPTTRHRAAAARTRQEQEMRRVSLLYDDDGDLNV